MQVRVRPGRQVGPRSRCLRPHRGSGASGQQAGGGHASGFGHQPAALAPPAGKRGRPLPECLLELHERRQLRPPAPDLAEEIVQKAELFAVDAPVAGFAERFFDGHVIEVGGGHAAYQQGRAAHHEKSGGRRKEHYRHQRRAQSIDAEQGARPRKERAPHLRRPLYVALAGAGQFIGSSELRARARRSYSRCRLQAGPLPQQIAHDVAGAVPRQKAHPHRLEGVHGNAQQRARRIRHRPDARKVADEALHAAGMGHVVGVRAQVVVNFCELASGDPLGIDARVGAGGGREHAQPPQKVRFARRRHRCRRRRAAQTRRRRGGSGRRARRQEGRERGVGALQQRPALGGVVGDGRQVRKRNASLAKILPAKVQADGAEISRHSLQGGGPQAPQGSQTTAPAKPRVRRGVGVGVRMGAAQRHRRGADGLVDVGHALATGAYLAEAGVCRARGVGGGQAQQGARGRQQRCRSRRWQSEWGHGQGKGDPLRGRPNGVNALVRQERPAGAWPTKRWAAPKRSRWARTWSKPAARISSANWSPGGKAPMERAR